jgi:hypothetical protein
LTDEKCKMILVEIDCNKIENKKPKQKLEENEEIEVLTFKKKNLCDELENYSKKNNCFIDVKLWSFAFGLKFSNLN